MAWLSCHDGRLTRHDGRLTRHDGGAGLARLAGPTDTAWHGRPTRRGTADTAWLAGWPTRHARPDRLGLAGAALAVWLARHRRLGMAWSTRHGVADVGLVWVCQPGVCAAWVFRLGDRECMSWLRHRWLAWHGWHGIARLAGATRPGRHDMTGRHGTAWPMSAWFGSVRPALCPAWVSGWVMRGRLVPGVARLCP
jgi:hypothetical protein